MTATSRLMTSLLGYLLASNVKEALLLLLEFATAWTAAKLIAEHRSESDFMAKRLKICDFTVSLKREKTKGERGDTFAVCLNPWIARFGIEFSTDLLA